MKKTVKQPQLIEDDLTIRNHEIEKAFNQIIIEARTLLTVFEHQKYRSYVDILHSKSGKDTNLIKEWLCYCFNITLTNTKNGSYLIYFGWDEEAIDKFGLSLFSKMLRIIFRVTMFEATPMNIESCVRINKGASNIHNFYLQRILNGENDFVSISVEERVAA
jgi:hypothetical protein